MDIPVMFSPGRARFFYETSPDRITERDHDDRNCVGCVLRGLCGGSGAYGNDVRLQTHTFGSKGCKPFALPVRGKIVDRYGLPIHVAQVAQALEECVKSWRPRLQRAWIERKKAEPRNFLGLLRACRERPRNHRTAEKRDKLAPFHICPGSPPKARTRDRTN